MKNNPKFIQYVKNNYPYVAIWVGPMLLIGSLLLSGKVVFWGTTYLQFLPWHWAGWELMKDGFFPLWNSYNGFGTPLLANYQSAFFYPPNLILWLFALVDGIRGIAIGQSLLVLIHLVISGYGMVNLAKETGLSKLGQAVAGIAYSLSGYLVARASFLSMNAALAWVPWILFYGLRIASISNIKTIFRSRDILFSILAVSMLLLSGHAQLAWYSLSIFFFWTITFGLVRNGFNKVWITISNLGIVMLFSIGLSAIQLLPTAELLINSQRSSSVEYSYALNYSFWPWRFLTLISPNLFGNPALGNYWVTADNFWEDNIYVGVLTFIFSITTVIRLLLGKYKNDLQKKVLVWFSITTIFFSIIFALGKNTPIFVFLYQYIPTFNMFQAPARFTIWMTIFLPILAGLGIEKWTKPTGKWLYWSRLLAAGAAGSTLTSILIWIFFNNMFQVTYIRGIVETGILLTILLSINLFVTNQVKDKDLHKPALIAVVMIFLLIDLVYSGWGVNPGLKLSAIKPIDSRTNNIEGQSLIYQTLSSEEEIKFTKFFRFDSFHPEDGWEALTEYFLPNTNVLGGFATVNNFDPLLLSRYDKLMSIISPLLEQNELVSNSFWGVDRIITGGQRFSTNIIDDDSHRIRWFTCNSCSRNEEESISELRKVISDETYMTRLVVENSVIQIHDCGQEESKLLILEYESHPLDTRIKVDASSNGWLMQLSTNYPGWVAFVDGKEVDLYYGDILFKTIYLSAGQHEVEFIYRPSVFQLGLFTTIVYIALLIGYIILQKKLRKSDEIFQ